MDTRVEETEDLASAMARVGDQARAASRVLATASSRVKDDALNAMADALRRRANEILAANELDLAAARAADRPSAYIDRLTLNAERIEGIAEAVESIAGLADPVGSVIAEWDQPNGLHIERVRTPLGVIGIIFESRPNVTADAGALCLKAGNASILRPGSDSFSSARAIHAALVDGLQAAGLPSHAIQLVPTSDREAVGLMLSGLNGAIDVIVPRGGKSLVGRVEKEARVPVFSHLEGICHIYVHGRADLDMAKKIVVNAKMRRTGICGAAECLLVDKAVAETHLRPIVSGLLDAGCEVHGDALTATADARVMAAQDADWGKEFLDAVIAVRVVDGLDAAIEHISTYGSHHTDAIVTDDQAVADEFMHRVDSAIVLHNASTQFADGGEFGMGAEIGIATGRMHARGPVGVEQLTSFKYRVRGAGQIRP